MDIYLASFPARASMWFDSPDGARIFYRDLFDLVRATYPERCLAFRVDGRIAGFALVTLPDRSLASTALRSGAFVGVGWRLLSGRYRMPLRTLRHFIRSALNPQDRNRRHPNAAHLYVIAVDSAYGGRGAGSSLIEAICGATDRQQRSIWLNVEPANSRAVRLYERFGFRAVESSPDGMSMIRHSGTPLRRAAKDAAE